VASPFHVSYPGAPRAGAEPPPPPRALPMGFRFGRIAGIEIRLDASVLVIALLVAFNLATGLLPAWHPGWSAPLIWVVALCAALLFFASILAHELSHAFVGRHYGIPVRRITLFIFGGMAELEREPDRPKVELLTALAGPALSIALGVVATLAGAWLGSAELGRTPDTDDLHRLGPIATLLLWLGPVNVMLGLFNLVPGFPLDGGRVLRAVLWWKMKRLDKATRWAARGGQAVAALLVICGIVMMFGYRVPLLGRGFGQGLWLVLIGWFLNSAAVRSYGQTVSRMRETP
jgi:Zn-dependent protease